MNKSEDQPHTLLLEHNGFPFFGINELKVNQLKLQQYPNVSLDP